MDAIERQMIKDIGLFRHQKPAITVERLLKDQQEKRESSPSASVSHYEPIGQPKDFIASMAARLGAVEAKAAQQEKMIKEKTQRIEQLESELARLSAPLPPSGPSESDRLRRQVFEMENFLSDYGMVWCGYRAGAEDEEEENDNNTAAAAAAGGDDSLPSELYFDVPLLLSRVGELNSLAAEDAKAIVKNSNGVAKFQPPSALSLVIYRDGIFFRNGPLRPYSLPACRAFIADLLDGYFPYELKEEFKDGVIINAVDKSKEYHGKPNHNNGFVPFVGVGNRLDGSPAMRAATAAAPTLPPLTAHATNPSSYAAPAAAAASSNIATLNGPSPTIGAAQFLSKLPAAVVAEGGQVVDIRAGIAKLLQPMGSGPASTGAGAGVAAGRMAKQLVDTPTLRFLSEHSRRALESRPKTPRDIATLQVKLDDGGGRKGPPLLLKMRFNDTISVLYEFIERERSARGLARPVDGRPYAFELRTAFPPKAHPPTSATLKESGLTPNASLFVRVIPPHEVEK